MNQEKKTFVTRFKERKKGADTMPGERIINYKIKRFKQFFLISHNSEFLKPYI